MSERMAWDEGWWRREHGRKELGEERQGEGKGSRVQQGEVPVSVKKNPPENHTHWNISFQIIKSGAGEQSLPLACRAKARLEGVFFRDTGR